MTRERRGSLVVVDGADESQLPDPKNTKILIGEGSLINSTVAKKFLEKLGYTAIVQVDNGVLAVAAAEKDNYSIIFLDVRMPVVGGVEATKLIRKYEREKHKPPATIIGLTAVYTDKDKAVCQDCGMDCVLRMPLHFTALRDVLLRYGRPKTVDSLKNLLLMYITNQPHIFQYNSQNLYSLRYRDSEVFVPSDLMDELHLMKDSRPSKYVYPKFGDMDIDEILCIVPTDYYALKGGIVESIGAGDMAAVRRYAAALAGVLKYVSHDAANEALALSNCKEIEPAMAYFQNLSLEMDSVWD